jgi:type II secretory pathway component PulJ
VGVWRDERGFTLAELLTAFAMLALVLAGVVIIQQDTLQAYVAGSNKTEVQQNARVALERMAREIRESTAPLTTATANSITFTHPTEGAITYTIDGAKNLTRNGAPIIGGVQNLILSPALSLFVYRDANDAAGASAANTRRVDITIQTGSEDTVVAGGITDTRAELTTSVRLRNL